MLELEISINNSSADPETDLRAVLKAFETQKNIKINCTTIDWGNAWTELMKIVLYKHGPVLSQAGSTWMGSLESTEGLRPFQLPEIRRFGGSDAFLPASWRTGVSRESGQVFSIPWILDTYVLYYRRDIFEKAGIDETHAFESYQALDETMAKLMAFGNPIPLAMPTEISSRASLHNIASWVWSHGGEFISDDGRELRWSDQKTREGLKAYFSLYRLMPQTAQKLTDSDCYRVFLDGEAAMSLRNVSLLSETLRNPAFDNIKKNIGVAAMPGVSFIGGSNFVIWKHIRVQEERSALELLEYLSLPETQYATFIQTGNLPAHMDALKMLENDAYYAPILQAVLGGRAFRKMQLWGLVEDKLSAALGQIWQTLYSKENPDIETEIANVLDPLEHRLQLTISNT